MRVGSSGTHRSSTMMSQQGGNQIGGLSRSEFVSDIFNNRDASGRDKSDFKLRLSHLSRRMGEDLRKAVGEFLKQNPEILGELDKMELPESAYRGEISPKQAPFRKMQLYMQWLRMQGGAEQPEEAAESERPYWAIHGQGKNEEIKDLFAELDQQRKAFLENRNRHAPSYYYMAYPETYSFN